MSQDALKQYISKEVIPPYIYTYPTRSSYRVLKKPRTASEIWKEDLQNSLTDELNLYLHVPFCHYKCGYCNLYTVVSKSDDLYTDYVDALCLQLKQHAEIIQERTLRTVYIGGGTPSLLSPHHFEKIFDTIHSIYPNWRNSCYEVSIEATPDSIVDNPDIVKFLMSKGLTRMNMGVQSLVSEELKRAGRVKANEMVIEKAIEIIKASGLPNLSTDLINGFNAQTDASWRESVDALCALRPETISTYFLTVRPDAAFSRTGDYSYFRDPSLYKRYDYARQTFLDAGYVQETNIRYKIQGRGGYLQKALQFHGVPYLGIGSGARTYTNTTDYLVSVDTQAALHKVQKYIDDVNNNNCEITVGFEYDDEERIRKRLVLDMFDLDLKQFDRYNYAKHAHKFEPVLALAKDNGLIDELGSSRIQLTSKGYKYRDILSWMLVSDRVRSADHEFYNKLHLANAKAVERTKGSPESHSIKPLVMNV